MLYSIAVDVGGTKIAVGVVGDDGSVYASDAVVCADFNDGDELVKAAVARAEELAAPVRDKCVVVGCATAGPMEPRGEFVSPHNMLGKDGQRLWYDYPLRSRLEELFDLPTYVDNDCKALALGEAWVGGARGKNNFIAMVVSTGVGGGIILDGRLLNGRRDNAGHIGHLIVEPNGEPCPCGSVGCLEAMIAGPAISRKIGGSPENASLEIKQWAGKLLGTAITSVANTLDLNLALVGGSVALGFGEPFFEAAQAEIDRKACLSFSKGTIVRPVELGGLGGLVGGARVGFMAIEAQRSPIQAAGAL
jgi:glucokinase